MWTYCRRTRPCLSKSCHYSRRLSCLRLRSPPSKSTNGCCTMQLESSAFSAVRFSLEKTSHLTFRNASRLLPVSQLSMLSKPSLQFKLTSSNADMNHCRRWLSSLSQCQKPVHTYTCCRSSTRAPFRLSGKTWMNSSSSWKILISCSMASLTVGSAS